MKWCYSTITPARTLLTWQKTLQELGWEFIPHPPYSPNLFPLDFHLFSCRTTFKELPFRMKMCSERDLTTSTQNHVIFYRGGIEKLLQRWQTVVNSEGEYCILLIIVGSTHYTISQSTVWYDTQLTNDSLTTLIVFRCQNYSDSFFCYVHLFSDIPSKTMLFLHALDLLPIE